MFPLHLSSIFLFLKLNCFLSVRLRFFRFFSSLTVFVGSSLSFFPGSFFFFTTIPPPPPLFYRDTRSSSNQKSRHVPGLLKKRVLVSGHKTETVTRVRTEASMEDLGWRGELKRGPPLNSVLE